MIKKEKIPLFIVVSAPSGAGKTTLCERLLAEFDTIAYSVSCTTRPPRVGEEDGKDYFFLTPEAFDARIAEGAFLEHAVVHGHQYGTLKDHVLEGIRAGNDILMDLDVQGVELIRRYMQAAPDEDPLKRSFVDIFIAPPSLEILETRLCNRGKDEEDVIRRRMSMAETEMARWKEFSYLIINDNLDESYNAFRSIVIAEHFRNRP